MASNGCEPDIVTYSSLISGLCRAGRVQIATKLLNPILQALYRKKRNSEAMRLFREMKETADPPDHASHRIVFGGLCRSGGPIQEAVDFLIEMVQGGYLPEFASFYMLADGLRVLAMENTLMKLVNMLMEAAKFSKSEVAMIRGFLKIGKFEDGLANLGGILETRMPKKSFYR
ncbi:Pentatricopeptide repeat-containing protein At3g53700, chloroplastic [Linum perenne]